jgi:hypothetical protein
VSKDEDVEERAPTPPEPAEPDTNLEEKVIREARRWFPVVIVAGTLGAGYLVSPAVGILVLAAGAAIGAIAALWGSVRALVGETPLTGEDAFAMGAPSAEEERKRAVIRAIKDLQFEHSVGKISAADFAPLMQQYRAEAKELLRVLDERATPQREMAEMLVAEHLASEGVRRKPAAKAETKAETKRGEAAQAERQASKKERRNKKRRAAAEALKLAAELAQEEEAAAAEEEEAAAAEEERASARRVRCVDCGAANEPDAKFCKGCATSLSSQTEEAS